MTFYTGLLGDDDALAWSPTEATMPRIFNVNAKPFWQIAVRTVFARHPGSEPHESWRLTVLLTRHLAEREGVNPFADRADDTGPITNYMRTERHRLWLFCRKNPALLQLPLRWTNVTANMDDTGFIITGDAALDPNMQVNELGRTFRFKRNGHHFYSPLGTTDGTMIALWNDHGGASTRWHLSYSVAVDGLPYTKNPLPDAQELERAALKLWGGVIRAKPIWPRQYVL